MFKFFKILSILGYVMPGSLVAQATLRIVAFKKSSQENVYIIYLGAYDYKIFGIYLEELYQTLVFRLFKLNRKPKIGIKVSLNDTVELPFLSFRHVVFKVYVNKNDVANMKDLFPVAHIDRDRFIALIKDRDIAWKHPDNTHEILEGKDD